MQKDDETKAQDVLEPVTYAVRDLCVGSGDVRSRLKDAAFHLFTLREQDFPAELQGQYRRIKEAATRYDASDLDEKLPLYGGASWTEKQGRVEATMRRIRRSTGQNIARDIWSFYESLRIIAKDYWD